MSTANGRSYLDVTTYSSQRVKETVYTEIWREISALEMSMCALKRRHNSLGITTRLPPEILSAIFKWNTDILQEEKRSMDPTWITVTHVCSRWRRVALNCPSLWNRIPINISRRLLTVGEMLSRSKAMPLDAEAKVDAEGAAKEVQHVLKEIHRVRELCLSQSDFSDAHCLQTVLSSLTKPAPILETFEVFNLAFRQDSESALPTSLFGGRAPRLRSLALEKCSIHWESPVLTGLTTLKLESVPHSTLLPPAKLAATLGMIPDLQTLSLYLVFFPEDDTSIVFEPATLQKTHLHRLQQLELTDNLTPCTAFLSHIICPPTATLDLHIWPTTEINPVVPDPPAEILFPLRCIGSILSATLTKHVRCLEAKLVPEPVNWTDLLLFRTWLHKGTCLHPPSSAPLTSVEVTLLKMSSEDLSITGRLLHALCPTVQTTNLESLHINNIALKRRMWRKMFGGITSLKNVHIGTHGSEFVAALEADALDSEYFPSASGGQVGRVQQSGRLYFKALKSLVANTWDFGPPDKWGFCPVDPDALDRCLQVRRKRGVPLRELYFNRPWYLTSEQVERFRRVVKNVNYKERGL